MGPVYWNRFTVVFLVALLLAAGPLAAQGITPDGAAERVRFEAVARAVEKPGFAGPVVVGLSAGLQKGLFALLSTRTAKAPPRS